MKKTPILFSLFDSMEITQAIQKQCQYELGHLTHHQFPDGESVIRIESNVQGRDVVVLASLNQPNVKILPLIFAAQTARSLGCTRVTLIAPYLAYMRQDKVFEPGQGITSRYFAKLMSSYFDALITIDPHLHRWHTLNEIYSIQTQTLHATQEMAQWIRTHVDRPIVIGPDAESRQWAQEIAEQAGSPYLILEKTRTGDRSIAVSVPHIEQHRGATPVLLDDIISTGMTMLGAIKQLNALNTPPPVCIGVHAVFAGDAYQTLLASGVKTVVTCNTIQHPSNQIDLSHALSACLMETRP